MIQYMVCHHYQPSKHFVRSDKRKKNWNISKFLLKIPSRWVNEKLFHTQFVLLPKLLYRNIVFHKGQRNSKVIYYVQCSYTNGFLFLFLFHSWIFQIIIFQSFKGVKRFGDDKLIEFYSNLVMHGKDLGC